jgi:serine/threonine-protein kinase
MPQPCAQCGSDNDDDLAACFTCGQPLTQSVRLGQVIASRYEIRSRLGRGGMGAVYRAYDRVLEEDVALKVLREDAAHGDAPRRFRTEIKLARRVIHRNVSRIFEYGEEHGRRFISMELVEGTDLRHAIARQGRLPPDRAFSIAIQVAEGLEAIHQVGIIHRDLKASNIMLDASGTVRLMDFGIAKHVDQGATAATASGDILGTPAYMSPEQARGEKLDFRSDIYSLGVVTYELFTGRVPFEAEAPVALIMKHIHDPPPLDGPRAQGLPRALVPVLAKALAKSRDERFQSVGEMLQALRGASRPDAETTLRTEAKGIPADPNAPTAQWTATASPSSSDLGEAQPPGDGRWSPSTPATAIPRGGGSPDARSSAKTVLIPQRQGRQGRLAMRVAAATAGLLAISGAAFVVRPWVRTDIPTPTATLAVAPPPSTLAATTKWPVSIVALPWARVKIRARGEEAPIGGSDLLTPCLIELAEGNYTVELENGGITPSLTRDFEVARGKRNDFVFNMPKFDPASAAKAAVEDRP